MYRSANQSGTQEFNILLFISIISIIESSHLSSHFTKGLLNIFLQAPYVATRSNISWVELGMAKLVASSRDQGEIQKTKYLLNVSISIPI